MIYLDVFAFLYLLGVAVGVSLIMYYGFKIKVPGRYFASLIWAWLGAWIGTPVFGKWFVPISYAFRRGNTLEYICIIPSIIGAIVLLYLYHSFALCMGWKPEEKKAPTKEKKKTS